MIDDFRPQQPKPSRRLDGFQPTHLRPHAAQPSSRPLRDGTRPDQGGQAGSFAVANTETPELNASSDNSRIAPSNTVGQNNFPVFRTTEEVAAAPAERAPSNPIPEEELMLPEHVSPDGAATEGLQKSPKTIRLFRRWTVSRTKFIVAVVVAVVLLGGGGTAFALTRSKPAPVAVTKKPVVKAIVAPTPVAIVSPLTGLTVTQEQHDAPVIGVMIENSPDARPQSGLKEAGVVFEAIAEGGITRFLALYQENQAGNVGPVRSSRPYYLDWSMAFDASYAHVGGSPDALQRIKDLGVRDLDQFYNPSAYHRITARYAPHNVYTSVSQLTDLAKSKGYTSSTFTSWPRKPEAAYKVPSSTTSTTANTSSPGTISNNSSNSQSIKGKPDQVYDTRTPANKINFSISGDFYNVHYDYDQASNSYLRSEGGAAHMDAESKTQLAPKVVVALVMPYSLMADGYHSQYNTQGSGKMYVFQDGTVQTGTWTKGDPKSQFVFKDDAGKQLPLNAGQTWVSVVADTSKVSYQ